jgi:RNA polymerase sigma-70 factor, ECF subfamily
MQPALDPNNLLSQRGFSRAMSIEPKRDYQAHSDDSLLGQWRAGDNQAAAEVFARHSPRLLSAARSRLASFLSTRVDPEDIVQSTFKSFFRKAGNGGYLAPDSGDLFNLLIVIAMRKVNAKADYHQAASRDIRRTSESDVEPIANCSDEQPLRELCLTIDDLCQSLSPIQKQIVALRLESYSVAEIAEQTQRSKRTVERELQSFRKLLSGYFEP